MTGGTAAGSGYGTIYSYQIPSGGYAPNGNILQHSDSVMGTWIYSYDAVDRLVTGAQTASTSTSPQYAGMYGCWSYDSYGNRTMEAFSTATCGNNPVPQVVVTYNAANNRISTSTLSSATLTAGSFGYDASGNTLFDGNNLYWYDAEGQLCAVQSQRYSGSPVIQYIYDAEGARIGQGTLASAPSSYTSTCAPPFSAGFTLTKRYLVDQGGDQVTELDGAGVWKHSNIWAGGKLVATYDTMGIHFELTDPLGTKRVQANALGQIDEQCTGLPFGNDLSNNPSVSCSAATNSLGTNDDATEHHFTQKERDTETGNDYFFARYYSSALGRFTTPDWSAKVVPVPYAAMGDPQSLNLYGYVGNNPIVHVDMDGHAGCNGWCDLHGNSSAPTNAEMMAMNETAIAQHVAFSGNSYSNQTAQQQNQPQHDANHTVPLVVRDVSGQAGNPAGHVTVQVGTGSEVGFGPAQPMTKKQIAENASVPGVVEPRAAGAKTLDAVTIYLTPAEARNAQANINARAANPGNYQVVGSSCVGFGETIVHSTGARAPSDTLPSALIQDIRSMQIHDNSNQAP